MPAGVWGNKRIEIDIRREVLMVFAWGLFYLVYMKQAQKYGPAGGKLLWDRKLRGMAGNPKAGHIEEK